MLMVGMVMAANNGCPGKDVNLPLAMVGRTDEAVKKTKESVQKLDDVGNKVGEVDKNVIALADSDIVFDVAPDFDEKQTEVVVSAIGSSEMPEIYTEHITQDVSVPVNIRLVDEPYQSKLLDLVVGMTPEEIKRQEQIDKDAFNSAALAQSGTLVGSTQIVNEIFEGSTTFETVGGNNFGRFTWEGNIETFSHGIGDIVEDTVGAMTKGSVFEKKNLEIQEIITDFERVQRALYLSPQRGNKKTKTIHNCLGWRALKYMELDVNEVSVRVYKTLLDKKVCYTNTDLNGIGKVSVNGTQTRILKAVGCESKTMHLPAINAWMSHESTGHDGVSCLTYKQLSDIVKALCLEIETILDEGRLPLDTQKNMITHISKVLERASVD